ncbi:MAG TPA: AsmA family protein, partial [Alphaproteobacteria bacterium]
MKWLVRGILALVVLVVLVVGAGAVMLATFDPNDYKDKMSDAVRTATGRELAFGGDIKAVFFPVLGFEAAGLTLGNPDGFTDKEFLSVQDVAAGVKIMPLLERRIELTTIKLTGPQITVIKKADGHTNLELPKRPEAGAAQAEKETPRAPMAVSAEGVEITNAKITYKDLQTGKTTTISPLNLKMPGIAAGREVPVSLAMVISSAGGETKIAADGKMKPEPDSGKFTFTNLKSTIETAAGKLSLNADIAIDTRAQKIAVDNLRAEGNGTSLTGRVAINGFESPDVTFDISSPSVDLDALMPKQPKSAANDNKQLMPLDMLRKIKLDGNIAIGALKMSGLAMNDLKVTVKGDNGVITADPVTASLYDGALNTAVKIDARGATPAFSLTGALKNLQAGKLIEAKMGQDYVTGLANVDFDLNSRGNTMAALKGASGGRFAFNFGEGYINKWQLSRLINQAIAFFETGSVSQTESDRIHFTSLDGSFTG